MKHSVSLGIIGAGKLGITLAELAVKAGYSVSISGSGSSDKIRLITDVIAPGSIARKTEEVSRLSDVIILALPLGQYQTLPKDILSGKIVIDAMNYWWETDGVRDDLTQTVLSTSSLVQQHLSGSIVVKALSHLGYHDLYDYSRLNGSKRRVAVAISADESSVPEALDIVSDIVSTLGFDPVYVGTLQASISLQPHGEIFGRVLSADELRALLPPTL